MRAWRRLKLLSLFFFFVAEKEKEKGLLFAQRVYRYSACAAQAWGGLIMKK